MIITKVQNKSLIMPERTMPRFGNSTFVPNYGLKINSQITSDTVCFKSKGKKLQTTISKETKAYYARKAARELRDMQLVLEAKIKESEKPTNKKLKKDKRKDCISLATAKSIHAMIIKPQERIFTYIHNLFDDMLITPTKPKNIILHIQDRAKSSVSIMEKSGSRDWHTTKEILENMTDLNGAKLVMGYGTGKAETELALEKLIKEINNGKVELLEIELQRPSAIADMPEQQQEVYDYASKAFLDRLEDAQEAFYNGNNTNIDTMKLINRPLPKYTEGNYCALHLLLKMSETDARPFELQIMGPYMGEIKGFDDIRFKFFNGKKVESKYNQLIENWTPLLAKENETAKNEFLRYFAYSIFELRIREIEESKHKLKSRNINKLFKEAKGFKLTPEFSNLNDHLEIKRACDARAKQATRNLEKARKQKVDKDNTNTTDKLMMQTMPFNRFIYEGKDKSNHSPKYKN